MKARKITIGILASILTLNTFAQSADSASVGLGAVNAMTGQVTAPVWVDTGLTSVGASQVAGAITNAVNANNNLINAELAKRDATIANFQNQLNDLKTSGQSLSSMACPLGYSWQYRNYNVPGGSTNNPAPMFGCFPIMWLGGYEGL